jgi:2-polyprenyl-6-methoxyphenol hydroxylase-like FAD-dependent oxidoreductase
LQVAGVTDQGLKPRSIRSVAIIGGGLMGSGIATALVLAGIPVLLKEVNEEFLQAGVDRITGQDLASLRCYIGLFVVIFCMPLAWSLAVLQLALTQYAQETHMVAIPFLHVVVESQVGWNSQQLHCT